MTAVEPMMIMKVKKFHYNKSFLLSANIHLNGSNDDAQLTGIIIIIIIIIRTSFPRHNHPGANNITYWTYCKQPIHLQICKIKQRKLVKLLCTDQIE